MWPRAEATAVAQTQLESVGLMLSHSLGGGGAITLRERRANGPGVLDMKNADCGTSQLQGSDCEPFMITAAECVGPCVEAG